MPAPGVMSIIKSLSQVLLTCDASLRPGQGDVHRRDSWIGNLPGINIIIGTELMDWL